MIQPQILVLLVMGGVLLVSASMQGGCATTLDRASVGTAKAETALATHFDNVFRDGNVYFAGQPTRRGIEELDARGVTTIVNLRRPEELESLGFDEPERIKQCGMTYVTIPLTPKTFSREDVDRFAGVLAGTPGPVAVHCGSSNRVGGLWAAYLAVHRGYALDEAIRLGRAAGMRGDSMVRAVRRVAGEAGDG